MPNLCNGDDHSGQRLLTGGVDAGELRTKVIENGSEVVCIRVKLRKRWRHPCRFLPKQAASLSRDKVDAILMGPVVDLQLFAERDSTENHRLKAFRRRSLHIFIGMALTWKPLTKSTVISCPGLPARFRTGTYALSSARRGTVTSPRGFPTSSAFRKNCRNVSSTQ